MRIFAGLLDKLYRVAAKYRCASIVVGAAALAPLSLGISEPALAQCSAVDASGNATCSAGTYTDTGPTAGHLSRPHHLQPALAQHAIERHA